MWVPPFFFCLYANKNRTKIFPMKGILEQPRGFLYRPEFITLQQERELLEFVSFVDFHEVVMHNQTARRVVRSYGYGYDFETRMVTHGESIPRELYWIRRRAEQLAGLPPGAFVEALVTKYPRGATIGWHRDSGVFGNVIVGLSLSSPAIMRFRRGDGDQRRVYERILNQRSAYVISEDARSIWQHSIPVIKQDRYSITFRTLRDVPD